MLVPPLFSFLFHSSDFVLFLSYTCVPLLCLYTLNLDITTDTIGTEWICGLGFGN